jgi:hypothetical protein
MLDDLAFGIRMMRRRGHGFNRDGSSVGDRLNSETPAQSTVRQLATLLISPRRFLFRHMPEGPEKRP